MKNLLCILLISLLVGCGMNTPITENSGKQLARRPPKSTWTIDWYGNIAVKPITGPPGTMYFNFPAAGSNYPACIPIPDVNCNQVNYVTENYSGTAHGLSMTFEINTTGTPVFNYVMETDNTCNTPASLRLYFEERGDNGYAEYYRWWANPNGYYNLQNTNGLVTLTMPFTPGNWSDVNGNENNSNQAAVDGFNKAIANIQDVGFTLGGGCFFGHGVNVSGGTAQFVLQSYTVN